MPIEKNSIMNFLKLSFCSVAGMHSEFTIAYISNSNGAGKVDNNSVKKYILKLIGCEYC